MKIAALIARILLGLVFVVFGANGFLDFYSKGAYAFGNCQASSWPRFCNRTTFSLLVPFNLRAVCCYW